MKNQQLADIFNRIADLLEIKGEVIYKTLAYRKAAESMVTLGEDINTVYAAGRLQDIPGVGKAIAEKIGEYVTTGKITYLEKLEAEVPPTLIDLLQVPDVGPKKVAMFWKQANITTLQELEFAARTGRLRNLPGMGEKSEARILAGIEALGRRTHRQALGTAWPVGQRWLAWLRSQPGVEKAEFAGSLRRGSSTIGDLDLVAASCQPVTVMDVFIHHPEVKRVLGNGENKSSVETDQGLNIQLWIQPPERFGTLLQFVTGSKDHNVRLRELAQKKNLSLSERCILQPDGSEALYADEEGVYQALGLPYIVPELREDHGEIQAALNNALPHLIEQSDLHADLHTHSTWSDSVSSLDEMVAGAVARNIRVYAVTDHSGGLGIANGLTPERLRQQRIELDRLQQQYGDKILLLQGAEVEIHADGNLDFPDEVLASLDVVVASLHSSLRQPREVITERLLKVMRNPHVDIIGHPSGRLLPNRDGADLDWDAVLAVARENGLALEINANPFRLDLDEVHARRAAEMGIPLTIDTDSHAVDQLDQVKFGVLAARRAWVTPPQVVNAWPVEKILAWLKARGK
jgi:DNA polymerase (family 10)